MAGDWIKLHRKSIDSQVFSDATAWHLFCYLLLSANWSDGWFDGVKIPRGTAVFGRKTVANYLGISESSAYRALHRLEKYGCVTIKANNKWTRVTICNYETYQQKDSPSEQQMDNGRTTDEQQMDTIEEEQEQQEGQEYPPKSPQGGSSRRELRKKAGASFEELMQAWRAHSGEAQYEPAKFWARLPEATKAATRACGGFSWLSSVGATNRSSEKKKFIQAILEPQGA